MATRLALVDMGTNTLKYSIVDLAEDGTSTEVDVFADTVRLGAGIATSGIIDPQRADRALGSLRIYQLRAEALGAENFLGVATSALRRASNGQQLLDSIAEQTRWDVKVISGDLEARLTWAGLRHLFPPEGDFLLVDIGGGSSEALAIHDRELIQSESNDIGSGVLADEAFTIYPPGDQVEQAFILAREFLAKSRVLATVDAPGLVLSGGNGMFLAALARWDEVGIPFTPDHLPDLMRRVASIEPDSIAAHLGITPERARMIPAGAAIAAAAADLTNASALFAVPSGIRTGMVHAWHAGEW